MREQNARRQGRLRILAPHADNGAPRSRWIVVNQAQDVLLPVLEPQRLADELALGNKAHRLDERDHIGRGERPWRRTLLTRTAHRTSWRQSPTAGKGWRPARTCSALHGEPCGSSEWRVTPSARARSISQSPDAWRRASVRPPTLQDRHPSKPDRATEPRRARRSRPEQLRGGGRAARRHRPIGRARRQSRRSRREPRPDRALWAAQDGPCRAASAQARDPQRSVDACERAYPKCEKLATQPVERTDDLELCRALRA